MPRGQGDGSLRPYSRHSRPEPLLFLRSNSLVVLTRLSGLCSRPTTFQKIWYRWESNQDLCICSQEPWPLDHRGGQHENDTKENGRNLPLWCNSNLYKYHATKCTAGRKVECGVMLASTDRPYTPVHPGLHCRLNPTEYKRIMTDRIMFRPNTSSMQL
jgi:hypothetical protein